MGVRPYLIDGVSGAGKTAAADEFLRRGHQAIHGDRELAYRGDPETGPPVSPEADAPAALWMFEHVIWDVQKVRAYSASRDGSGPRPTLVITHAEAHERLSADPGERREDPPGPADARHKRQPALSIFLTSTVLSSKSSSRRALTPIFPKSSPSVCQ